MLREIERDYTLVTFAQQWLQIQKNDLVFVQKNIYLVTKHTINYGDSVRYFKTNNVFTILVKEEIHWRLKKYNNSATTIYIFYESMFIFNCSTN